MLDATAGKPTILVAHDLTPASRGAFDQGVRLAKELGGRLVLVHAAKPLGAPGLEPSRPPARLEDNETAEPTPGVGVAGTEWIDLARAQGVPCDIVVRPGLPAAVIVEEAMRLDVHTIVLGTQGKTGITKLLLGSVAEDVRKGTSKPVVVVPSPEMAPADTRPARPRRERDEHEPPFAGTPEAEARNKL